MGRRLLPLLLLSLTACSNAATSTQTGLATSGQALMAVGNTFVTVGATYQANCLPAPKDAKLAKFCAGFKEFAPRFQRAYPLAVDAWKAARSANDASKAQDAAAVVLQLSTDLTIIATQALGGS